MCMRMTSNTFSILNFSTSSTDPLFGYLVQKYKFQNKTKVIEILRKRWLHLPNVYGHVFPFDPGAEPLHERSGNVDVVCVQRSHLVRVLLHARASEARTHNFSRLVQSHDGAAFRDAHPETQELASNRVSAGDEALVVVFNESVEREVTRL